MSYSAETVPSSQASSHTILHLELEKEVVKILEDDNLDDLKRLTRFRLYQDDGLLGSILRGRPEVTLDTFLVILRLEAGHPGPHPDLDITQKVQEILRLLPQRPPSPNLSWDWKPEDAMYEVDIESIATDIDKASHLQLRQIPFEGWVRYSIGYSEASVERFFDQHRILRDKLSSFLSGSPDAFTKFSLVEKKLQNRSPFAHWVVINSLLPQPHGPTRNFPCAEFILGPLRELFAKDNRKLSELLQQLALLSLRFKQSYIREIPTHWGRFQTDTAFFGLLCGSSSSNIARDITTRDINAVFRLRPRDFIDISDYLKLLDSEWKELCLEVESVVTESTLGVVIVDLAMASGLTMTVKYH